ncbi:maltose/maltodextrin ABC transporter substrate-binding protein MalE [Cognatiyoonia sp. IB215182]|uniref:maltose/maltodextrin ABC transporter substrate-binding protein MalE n=1 Tax=Cognatiyoonia sp. IB215182 TaxID=3097353 RepID=UPI002A183A0D|nr:maltose/maltodextrin ABC transporter substrate-binding protein MalE [Cognatiyoonia sp. IB215182]MDX8351862.1 maltose/maltodextrin ABC transporter substrate-binding protein MalE [Cognatiyoonia sp. IB215182]
MKKTLTTLALLLTTAAPAAALEDGKILIWTGNSRDRDALLEAVQPLVDDLGVEVAVEIVDPDLAQKFQQAAATGDGPDIVLWAHDRFGEWASGGLIAPVQPAASWSDDILPAAMDAVQFDGKTWGYPLAVEAVTLIYNKDIIDTPPASFEEIKDLDVSGQKILWDYNNTYFTMPLLMAGGGYAFQKVDGSYDGSTTGVNTEGAIAGAEVLKSLFDDGVMPQGVDYGVMDGAMNNGEVAMVLNGPWSWGAFKDSEINIGVAPIPTVNGEVSPPFLGVQVLGLNAASPNTDLAVELIENYLATDDGLAVWNANGALGALADMSAATAQGDPLVTDMLAVAANGVPMPSNPEMGAFWAAMAPALTNITTGAAAPADALNDAAARILGE